MAPHNYALVRTLAGGLFLLDLLAYLPYAKVCLGGGYWGHRGRQTLSLVVVLWVAGAASLLLGVWPIAGAAIMWLLFRRFYIRARWLNLFRGGGAPGFMSHWVALYLLLFEAARLLDGSGELTEHVGLMCNVDLGVILLCSGSYKALSGYLHGEGMEYGLANPFWSYFFRWFRRRRPSHLLFRVQDAWAPIAQILTGVCLLIPPLRTIGAVLCMMSFGYLIGAVRLGRLAALMMVGPILFLPELGVVPRELVNAPSPLATPGWILIGLHGATVGYIALLPCVKAMQYLNLFAKRQLPSLLQRSLTWYANTVPIIMWRVFSPDVTNFFVRIYRVDEKAAEATPLVHEDTTYSYRQLGRFGWSMRYLNVTESIALTTVFTTLKYFSSQRHLFEEKLRQYARTLDQGDAAIRFQYVAILKGEAEFEFLPVSNFTYDPSTEGVTEEVLVPGFPYDAPARFSHIKETIGYGSYLPKSVARG